MSSTKVSLNNNVGCYSPKIQYSIIILILGTTFVTRRLKIYIKGLVNDGYCQKNYN